MSPELIEQAHRAAERPVAITYTFCKYPDCKRGLRRANFPCDGPCVKQAKVKSITRVAMPVLIAARRSTMTELIASISFRRLWLLFRIAANIAKLQPVNY